MAGCRRMSDHVKSCSPFWMTTCWKSPLLSLMASCAAFCVTDDIYKPCLMTTVLCVVWVFVDNMAALCLSSLTVEGGGARKQRINVRLSGWKGRALPAASCQPSKLTFCITVGKKWPPESSDPSPCGNGRHFSVKKGARRTNANDTDDKIHVQPLK